MITTFRPTHLAALAVLALALAGVAAAVRLADGAVPPQPAPAIGGYSDTTPSLATPADSSSSPADAPALSTDQLPLAIPQQPAAVSASGGSIVMTPDTGATSTTPAAGSAPLTDGHATAPSRWSEWPNDMPPPAILAPTQSLPKRPLPQTSP